MAANDEMIADFSTLSRAQSWQIQSGLVKPILASKRNQEDS